MRRNAGISPAGTPCWGLAFRAPNTVRSLNIDGFRGSAEDLQFPVHLARARRVLRRARASGHVGHSVRSAREPSRFAAQSGCWATRSFARHAQDYYSTRDAFFRMLVREITDGIAT